MRKFLALLLTVCWIAPALAQVPMTGAGKGTPGAPTTPTYTFTEAPAGQSPGTSTATFTSVNIGTASADRVVIVSLNTEGVTAASLTIGGVSASKATSDASGVSDVSIWYLNVTTGTTATIVATSSGGNFTKAGVIVGYATGINATPTQTQLIGSGTSPRTLPSITVPSTGFAIAHGVTQNGGTGQTWSGATQNASLFLPSATKMFQAITTTTSAPQLSWSGGGNGHIVGAAWGP